MALVISEKGWVVIPAELRRKYALKPGSTVQIVDYGGVLALVPTLTDPIKQAAGMLKGKKSLTRSLLAERRADRRREATRGQ
ncbi:MAG TPA: AbrB/MazE/SpoVT family DNA-binding domain-containing protein [Anaerolineales bacterium]|nr:AbrB/MazE/SpoVT family DNA-binding domain-containing protein [Anaerolineales bacterium]